jgi:Ulp1 family protease
MQQEKLDLFKYDVLFMPVNQDSHWSLIVVNKPREIFEKLLSSDFEEEEEQQNAEEETVSSFVEFLKINIFSARAGLDLGTCSSRHG